MKRTRLLILPVLVVSLGLAAGCDRGKPPEPAGKSEKRDAHGADDGHGHNEKDAHGHEEKDAHGHAEGKAAAAGEHGE